MSNGPENNGRDKRGWFKKGNKCHAKKRRQVPKSYKKDLPKVVEMFILSAHTGGQAFVDGLRKDDASKFVTALCTLSRFAETDPESFKTPKCEACGFDAAVETIQEVDMKMNDWIAKWTRDNWSRDKKVLAGRDTKITHLEQQIEELKKKLEGGRMGVGASATPVIVKPADAAERDAAIDQRRQALNEQRMLESDDPEIWR